eukprot:8357207-Lingulodinium_polyedra.AAC.1
MRPRERPARKPRLKWRLTLRGCRTASCCGMGRPLWPAAAVPIRTGREQRLRLPPLPPRPGCPLTVRRRKAAAPALAAWTRRAADPPNGQ